MAKVEENIERLAAILHPADLMSGFLDENKKISFDLELDNEEMKEGAETTPDALEDKANLI